MESKSIINHINYGKVRVCLDEALKEKNLSKTSLAHRANSNYKNIKRLCDGDVQRVDLDILARICYVMNCEISDIIKYENIGISE